jgi:hypothetical protein
VEEGGVSRTALYRHFDAAGALLYVGISMNTIQRTAQHKHGAKWFQRIARIDIEWHPTRSAALTAEAIAIAKENPECNQQRPNVCKVVAPKTAAPLQFYAVEHELTRRIDGWYARYEDAVHLLGWFRTVFARDRFRLVADPFGEPRNWLRPDWKLRSVEHADWSATEPDYAAGDAYDREAA